MFGQYHSLAGYKNDESISAVQKCIRRREPQLACFFATQIITCGYGQYLFKSLLMGISCEDIGFGCVEAPRLVRDQFARWRKALQQRKLKSSDAYKCEEAVRIALDTTSRLALMPSSRMVATAAGVSFALTDGPLSLSRMREAAATSESKSSTGSGGVDGSGDGSEESSRMSDDDDGKCGSESTSSSSSRGPQAHSAAAPSSMTRENVDAYGGRQSHAERTRAVAKAFAVAVDSRDDGKALFYANLVFLCGQLDALKTLGPDLIHSCWTSLLACARKLRSKLPKIARAVAVLHEVYFGKEYNASKRLLFFEAVLLVVRGEDANWGAVPKQWVRQYSKQYGIFDGLDKACSLARSWHAREFAVPDFALDKHTLRGKGHSTVGRVASLKHKATLKSATWSDEERAKSHGPGRVLPEGVSLISSFFDEGAAVVDEWMVDPYFDMCRSWYLQNEAEFGSRQAKSAFMAPRSLAWIQAYLVDVFSLKKVDIESLAKPAKQPKTSSMSLSTSRRDGRNTGASGSSVSHKKEAKRPSTRSRAKSKSSAMSIASSESEDEEWKDEDWAAEAELEVTAKKKSKPMRKATKTSKAGVPMSEILQELGSEMKPISETEVAEIMQAPLGQPITGNAKKGVYQTPKYAWKGPYDISKAGDALKLRLMWRRIALMHAVGVNTPNMDLFRVKVLDGNKQMYVYTEGSKRSASYTSDVWTRYPQLSKVPSSEWRIVDKCGVKCVDRESMKVVQAHKIDEKLYQTNKRLLGEMLCAMASRYITEVVTGDSHFANLLVVSGHVYNVDMEEKRRVYPEPILTANTSDSVAVGTIADWKTYVFAMRPRRKLVNLIEKSMKTHAPYLRGVFEDFDTKCMTEGVLKTKIQRVRWKCLYEALKNKTPLVSASRKSGMKAKK